MCYDRRREAVARGSPRSCSSSHGAPRLLKISRRRSRAGLKTAAFAGRGEAVSASWRNVSSLGL
jgi:hypothetical protein